MCSAIFVFPLPWLPQKKTFFVCAVCSWSVVLPRFNFYMLEIMLNVTNNQRSEVRSIIECEEWRGLKGLAFNKQEEEDYISCDHAN